MMHTYQFNPSFSKQFKAKSLAVVKFLMFAFTILILYFPIFIITLQSFNNSTTGTTFGGFTLRWYIQIFEEPRLVAAIINSISIALLSTLAATVLGTLAAVGIHSLNSKKRKNMILINNIPVLNADIVTGVFLMLIFLLLQALLPNALIFGYFTMLFAHIFFSIPYVVLSVLPKLNEIDKNLFDAAQDLGCTRNEALLKVIIPSIKAGIIAGAMIAFTMSIDDFVISYFTTGNGVQNFSIWIYSNMGKSEARSNVLPLAYAYNTIISSGTLLGLLFYNITRMRKKYKEKKIEEKGKR